MANRPSTTASNDQAAREVLRPLQSRLEAVGGGGPDNMTFWLLDPVGHAAKAIFDKIGSPRVGDLHHSSKLYRAIDDIESTALLMPKYKGSAHELRAIASELRRISGWREGD